MTNRFPLAKLDLDTMGILIQGGTLLTADGRRRADVRTDGRRIAAVGPELAAEPGDETLDASGLLVMPGGVDPHVHLSLPVAGTVSADDFASGTRAALAGGTTTVIDFVHPERGQDPLEALTARREQAGPSVVDVALHMAVTWWDDDATPGHLERVVAAGVPSWKVYLAYKEAVGLDDADVVRVFGEAARLGATVLVHAEHGDAIELLRERAAASGHTAVREHARTRPAALEGEATNRAAVLAGVLDARLYVVHVTCREAVEAIERARTRGWPVCGETCPQYLLLDEAVYERPFEQAADYVIAPPLRPKSHQEILWRALGDGTLEAVGTDHCPFTSQQKAAGRDDFRRVPGGAAGIEHRLSLLWTHGVVAGRLSQSRFVELVSTGPARRFGLHPRKGTIEPGADADLVLWDPEAEATISAATHHHRTDRSVYEGFPVRGLARTVVAGGEVRFREGESTTREGAGRFLERPAGTGGPSAALAVGPR